MQRLTSDDNGPALDVVCYDPSGTNTYPNAEDTCTHEDAKLTAWSKST